MAMRSKYLSKDTRLTAIDEAGKHAESTGK
jgi:hypothetical protein